MRYSTIWLARALPSDGKIITLEISPHHAKVRNSYLASICACFILPKVAEENLKFAGFTEQVSVIVGPAASSLAALHPEQPFDLVFIDADKISNVLYFTEAKRLVRSGGIIVRYYRPMHEYIDHWISPRLWTTSFDMDVLLTQTSPTTNLSKVCANFSILLRTTTRWTLRLLLLLAKKVMTVSFMPSESDWTN